MAVKQMFATEPTGNMICMFLGNSTDGSTLQQINMLTSGLLDYLSDQSDVTPLALSSTDGNITDYLLTEGDEDLETFVNSHIVGVEYTTNFSQVRANGLFQHEARHSSPLALNTVTNMLFK